MRIDQRGVRRIATQTLCALEGTNTVVDWRLFCGSYADKYPPGRRLDPAAGDRSLSVAFGHRAAWRCGSVIRVDSQPCMKTLLTQFLSGAVALAFWAIGLFFMRFAAKTNDRFFTVFAWAFWVLA